MIKYRYLVPKKKDSSSNNKKIDRKTKYGLFRKTRGRYAFDRKKKYKRQIQSKKKNEAKQN